MPSAVAAPFEEPSSHDAVVVAMRTFPKSRVDALTDGIFAFAMTLLVLEIRLPPDLPIRNAAELIAHLRTLVPEYVTYLISFFVLATQWRASIEFRHAGEQMSFRLLHLWLVYLFFVTSVPFSSSVVGHYGDMAPAVWLYAANMLVVAGLSIPLRVLEVAPERGPLARSALVRTLLFMATALASVMISLYEPSAAMFAYLLNMLSKPIADRWGKAGRA